MVDLLTNDEEVVAFLSLSAGVCSSTSNGTLCKIFLFVRWRIA